ncbi:hypothetical protein MSAN_00648400 [Mycena sanguinolenta]|uniref:Yeast cell wall synthesis Kre9/Knh1-like N-terminal domain-containing protein n=1 Tax=Mycena sanguinolenta TaxID=230812 RepID=A0A8H6Z0X9_9AGAR|nr:hypothetical protein MSAN_00648400 [Mycena sanguinolenta]
MFSLSSATIAFALASSAHAALFITSPTQTISFVGGQPANITWMDDSNQPPLSSFGLAKISIYAGNSIDQTELQSISNSTDVTNPLFITFIPDPSIGPDSSEYFIRFESLTVKDSTDPTASLLAFSHVFTMSGMTGAFDAEVLSEISGQSTAPIGGVSTSSTPAASASQTTGNAVVTGSSKTSATASSASKSASAKPSTTSGSSAAIPAFAAGRSLWLGIGMAAAAAAAIFS